MNDEIKEILEELRNEENDIKGINFLKYQDLTRGQINLLLDYITNLQQDTEMYAQLKEEYEQDLKEANDSITWWTNRFKAVQQENKRLKEQINQYENPDKMNEIKEGKK